MNILRKHLRDYLELRRGLGFELGRVESRLRSFVGFMKIKRTACAYRSSPPSVVRMSALVPAPTFIAWEKGARNAVHP
jgi:hypothetical protein